MGKRQNKNERQNRGMRMEMSCIASVGFYKNLVLSKCHVFRFQLFPRSHMKHRSFSQLIRKRSEIFITAPKKYSNFLFNLNNLHTGTQRVQEQIHRPSILQQRFGRPNLFVDASSRRDHEPTPVQKPVLAA